MREIGHSGRGFAFDNESPRHRVFTEAYGLASRPSTNAEYLEFLRDDGYSRPELWLSDGWALINEKGWDRPLYWEEDLLSEFTLAGLRQIDPQAPVSHVSYYEADAFARWAEARLPTEFEWEHAASVHPVDGNLLESGFWHPAATSARFQFFGDVWEWTSSAYAEYPGYKPLDGTLGEYNGKFMCNQLVLRGGSCATPQAHVRATYRNFFFPHQRWQFSGIRLARDAS